MSLINCPECSKEVSDKAEQCPNCGYPLHKNIKEIKQKAFDEYSKISLRKNGRDATKIAKKLFYFLVLNNIPCSMFPEVEEWRIVKVWVQENSKALEKVTLEDVKKVSKDANIASKDYEEYKKFIEHYSKLHRLKQDSKRKLELENEIWEESHSKTLEDAKKEIEEKIKPTQNSTTMPKCPNCGSIRIESISNLSRVTSIGILGLASSKIGKTKQCKACGYKW